MRSRDSSNDTSSERGNKNPLRAASRLCAITRHAWPALSIVDFFGSSTQGSYLIECALEHARGWSDFTVEVMGSPWSEATRTPFVRQVVLLHDTHGQRFLL